MTRQDLITWSEDRCIIVGCDPDVSDGRLMAIVQDHATVEHDNWELFCESIENLDKDNYGFADEYTTCSDCGRIIRTSPDCWGWSPDFWLGDGEIICSECLPDCEDDYLEWLADQSGPSGCILDEDTLLKHGFTCLLQGLRNGMHEGDTDNPTAILEYLRPSYEVAFVVSPSQFTTGFDVYIRKPYGVHNDDTIEDLRVPEKTIAELRRCMVKSTYLSPYGNTDTLLTEFANLYTAKAMKAGLRAISSLPAQKEGTTRLVKVQQDGIECLDITPSEFIAGDLAREFLS